jgi:site-specific recombinase XerD
MTTLAPILEAFFTDRLMKQRRVSPNTISSYGHSFRLLLKYLQHQTGNAPSDLRIEDLDATTIIAFLSHLEQDRTNSVSTRNARLAAIHSFFRYAALVCPQHAGLIQRVLAIPQKNTDHQVTAYLTPDEVDALLATPDRSTRGGRRDHAVLVLAIQTGVRVSELTGLCCGDIELGKGPHIRVSGKRRKERCTPLKSETVTVLRAWMRERNGQPTDPLFPGRHNGRLSPDAVQRLIAKHATSAAKRCPSLRKKSVAPHVLRHTCAMTLLAAGVDQAVIALWLGHERLETTDRYIHSDMAIKERALARTAPLNANPARYRAPDALLAFLEGL